MLWQKPSHHSVPLDKEHTNFMHISWKHRNVCSIPKLSRSHILAPELRLIKNRMNLFHGPFKKSKSKTKYPRVLYEEIRYFVDFRTKIAKLWIKQARLGLIATIYILFLIHTDWNTSMTLWTRIFPSWWFFLSSEVCAIPCKLA